MEFKIIFEVTIVIVMIVMTMSFTMNAMAKMIVSPSFTGTVYIVICLVTMSSVCAYVFGERSNPDIGTIAGVMLILNTAIYLVMNSKVFRNYSTSTQKEI